MTNKGLRGGRINTSWKQEECVTHLVLPISCHHVHRTTVLTLRLTVLLVWRSECRTHTVSNNYTNLRRRKY